MVLFTPVLLRKGWYEKDDSFPVNMPADGPFQIYDGLRTREQIEKMFEEFTSVKGD